MAYTIYIITFAVRKLNPTGKTMTTSSVHINDLIYRTFYYIRHLLRARNTLGYGVHSPFLYDLIHFVMYDDNAYYCFRPIEQERQRLLGSTKTLQVTDLGTGTSGKRSISHIARTSLKTPQEAQMLFRILNALKPQCVIELGTSLGITTAYLSNAAPKAQILTFEGCPNIAQEAGNIFQRLQRQNIKQYIGNIDDQLPEVLKALQKPVDAAFIDANHRHDATLHYFQLIAKHCSKQSIIIIDDIHASRGMTQAWNEIQQDPRVHICLDCFQLGIVFFRKQLPKKTYYMHI